MANDDEITYEPESDPEDVGVTEHVPATVTQKSLNADILRMLERPGKIWWGVFLLDLLVLAIGMVAERNQMVRGIGVAGHTRPVMWASYVANFVFWVGIAHCEAPTRAESAKQTIQVAFQVGGRHPGQLNMLSHVAFGAPIWSKQPGDLLVSQSDCKRPTAIFERTYS